MTLHHHRERVSDQHDIQSSFIDESGARIVVEMRKTLVGVDVHAAELHQLEDSAVLAQPALTEKRWAPGFPANRDDRYRDQWSRQDQRDKRERDVECSHGHAPEVGATNAVGFGSVARLHERFGGNPHRTRVAARRDETICGRTAPAMTPVP